MKELINGIDTFLECSGCSKTLLINIPLFNNPISANEVVWSEIIGAGWLSYGEKDTLLCKDCRDK